MTTSIDTIRDDFSFLDEWEDRYRYVIELGEALPPFPRERADRCQQGAGLRQPGLAGHPSGRRAPIRSIRFEGDSDAHIVRGLVAIMLALFSGHRASEIVGIDAEATLRELGLDEHLSPQRSNGLRSMVKRIKRDAEAALTRQFAVSCSDRQNRSFGR